MVNAKNLEKEIHWLSDVIDKRFKITFETSYSDQKKENGIRVIQPPGLEQKDSIYADFVMGNKLSFENRLLLILSLAPHIAPQLLDKKLPQKTDRSGRPLSEIGGVVGDTYRGFIPTGLTYLFLMAGYDIPARLELIEELYTKNGLIKTQIIHFSKTEPGEPLFNGTLVFNEPWLSQFITNKKLVNSSLTNEKKLKPQTSEQ
jgi:hypothetical protein